jgi:hypothetical protein
MCDAWTWTSPVFAATAMVAGYGRSFVEVRLVLKCRFAFGAIARRYGGAIRACYRTESETAFPLAPLQASDGKAPDWRAFTSIRRSIP